MKCDKIAQRAERLIDAEGEFANDTSFVADVLNEFQEDITVKPVTTTSIVVSSAEVTDGVWKDLPADIISLYTDQGNHAILKDGVAYTGGYAIRPYGIISQIMFTEVGTFTVPYEKTPAEIISTALAATDPDMHPYLHSLGAIYLASKYKSRDDDENPDAFRLMNEYKEQKSKRLGALSNPAGVAQTVVNSMGW